MKKSILIALIISVVVVLWILSGFSQDNPDSPQTEEANSLNQDDTSSAIPEVRVQSLRAEIMADKIDVTGRTQASRKVFISSETDGQVSSLLVQKGDRVKQGQVLVKLAVRDRSARVSEAQQLVNQRDIQYNAAKELAEKGFNSRVRLAEAEAQLESAKAQLKMVKVELANINITAPFEGVINDQMVEIGDYVSKGKQILEIVDLDPIEISGFLTEKQISNVEEDQMVSAELLKGQLVEGKISFIASAANEETRTFAIEITLSNPDYKIKEGLTATLHIPIKEAVAYKVSPSILSLSDDGTVGVKLVDDQDIVQFMPIKLIKDTPEYLWIGGLPEKVRLITVGQEFVIQGQKVQPIEADNSEGKSLF